jgi:hypothetical protein
MRPMPRLLSALSLLAVCGAAGCRSDTVAGGSEGAAGSGGAANSTPALLKDPDAATRAELRRVVSAALGGVDVTLSDQALTDTSLLVIERRRHVDPAGRRIMGRDMGTSDRFMLFMEGDQCLLEHMASGKRWPLTGAECVSAPPEPTQQN